MTDRWGVVLALAGLYLSAVAAALIVGPSGPVYWDTFDYLRQAMTGQVGGLALGRPVFVLVSHWTAEVSQRLGISVWHIEPVLRMLWLAIAASAAPACAVLAHRCGAPRAAALVAGAVVAGSPAMAHTSATVLTDAPALATTVWALVACVGAVAPASVGWRRQAILAGLLAGLAFGLREQSAVAWLTLLWLLRLAPHERRVAVAWRMGVTFAATAAAPVIWLLLADPGYLTTVITWWTAMRQATTRPVTPGWFVVWLLSLGPPAVWLAVRAWSAGLVWQAGHRGPWMAVCLPAVAQLATLLFYPYLAYSPRYLLPVLPGAVALPAALWWEHRVVGPHARRWLIASLVLPLAIASPVLRMREAPLTRARTSLAADLRALPSASTIVTGQLCPAAQFAQAQVVRASEPRPDWRMVCPGWAWPADLASRLDADLASGRTVVLDLRPEVWLGAEQQAALREVRRYADGAARDLVAGRVRVWTHP